MSEGHEDREGNELLAREISAKRIARAGLLRDLDRFDRKVREGPPGAGDGHDDDHKDGWRLRWWWLR